MESHRVEELRSELNQLLKEQAEFLESQTFGTATDTELLEYKTRQEIIRDLCEQLGHSTEA